MAKILIFKKDNELTVEERAIKYKQIDDTFFIVSCGLAGAIATTFGIEVGKHINNKAWKKAMNLCYEKSPELKELTEKVAKEVADDLGI